MRLAITGTPGCGKTTLAGLLAEGGRNVFDVRSLADRGGAIAGHDEADDADAIDVDALAARISELTPADAVIEGHLSHLLPVDAAWVIRCHPATLKQRLHQRGYREAKVRENQEAEAMDLILQEALDHVPVVVQRDGTRRSPARLLSAFQEASMDATKRHDLEPVDWSDWLLG